MLRSIGGHKVQEFTPTGSLVQTIEFNYNGGTYPGTEYLRDIIVDQDGVISAFNGTFAPFLTRYSSSTGTFTHWSFPGWSLVNNIYMGRIASYKNYVFVNDENTFGGEPKGIVRFDTSNGTAVRFASTGDFADLTVGLDGYLYAVHRDAQALTVYDPVTLDFVRDIPFPAAVLATGFLSMAVDLSGKLYVAGWRGTVFRLSNNGVLEASTETGFDQLTDIEIDESGRLLMSAWGGRVIVGHTSLTGDFKSFLSERVDWASSASAVSFARPHSFPPRGTPTHPPESILGNISTRVRVETNDNALVAGFIISGTQPKKVIIRAIGPSLATTGIAQPLANPTLELYGPSGLIAWNDDWRTDQEAEVVASQVPPSDNKEAAIVATLPAGNAGYTAVVRGADNGTGVGVVEVYDLDPNAESRMVNISTRGLVQTKQDALVAGTIVMGPTPRKVIIRALGPSLGLQDALADPTLELRDGNGVLLEANDDWMNSPNKQAIIDSTIPPADSREAAIVWSLSGNSAPYTAVVRGFNETCGVALVDIYALD
jgi:hypothetical protein